MASGVVPSVSTDLVTEYISLPTTSRMNSLLEVFFLCAYLGRRENIRNIVRFNKAPYLTNQLTVLLNKSLGKAPIKLTMASAASLPNYALLGIFTKINLK